MEHRSTLFTVAAVTIATGVLAYAVYFDYKRRNDSAFRKKLRKEKKRVEKHVAQQSKEDLTASGAPSAEVTQDVLRQALDQIKNEPAPLTPDEKEAYFMQQVGTGEQLAARGPAFYLPAALAFFRALRVYPSPVELIVIYQKTVPEPVFKLIIDMTNLDVSDDPSSPATAPPPELADDEPDHSPVSGPPSETSSSQEWDRVTDPGAHP